MSKLTLPPGQAAPVLPSSGHTPSTLKKTVHLLSPEVLTNWYANRKRETGGGGAAVYGPRRNSISNLFFNPEKKASSSPLAELRQVSGSRDKLRKSMLNLEEILAGEGVLSRHHARVGKGIQRSESAKLTNDSKLEVTSQLSPSSTYSLILLDAAYKKPNRRFN